MYKRSLAIGEKTFGPDHPEVASHLTNWAVLLHEQGKHKEAIALLERVLSIRMQKLGENHPDTVSSKKSLEMVRKKVRA
ncbi:unnamed protein product [Ectocarpus sp. 12 AP-2014]